MTGKCYFCGQWALRVSFWRRKDEDRQLINNAGLCRSPITWREQERQSLSDPIADSARSAISADRTIRRTQNVHFWTRHDRELRYRGMSGWRCVSARRWRRSAH
jgi:hypothetical protein